MTVDELKAILEVATDKELANMLNRGVSSISNWRTQGSVPRMIENRAQNLKNSVGALHGDHNTVHVGVSMSPETQLINNLLVSWPDNKRKRLLRMALDLDAE